MLSPPKNTRLKTPTVGAIRQDMGPPMSKIFRMSVEGSKVGGKPTHRRTKYDPTRAWSDAPKLIAVGRSNVGRIVSVLVTSPAIETLTRNEPRNTPGHARTPNNKSPERAMPAGGQTDVAYPGGIASSKASFPATKYKTANPRMVAAQVREEENGSDFTLDTFCQFGVADR